MFVNFVIGGKDYTNISTTLIFSDSINQTCMDLVTSDDGLYEREESLTLSISPESLVDIGISSIGVTIDDIEIGTEMCYNCCYLYA